MQGLKLIQKDLKCVLLGGRRVSCVETIIALSRADRRTDKQTTWSSLMLLTILVSVRSLMQCGSVLGSENLSTQNHDEKLRPV